MKTKLLFTFCALLLFTTKSYSQFAFGVSPGSGMNSAYFAYKIDSNFVPFVGLQYFNAGFNGKDFGEEFSFSVGVFNPHIGLKYFFKHHENIKAYASLIISKPFLNAKLEFDGEEDESISEFVDNISLFGSEIGFGTEYFFDQHFSIGGEFGVRFISTSYFEDEDFFLKLSTRNTYSKFTLNFYF